MNIYLNEDSSDFYIEIEYMMYDFHDLSADDEDIYEFQEELDEDYEDDPDIDIIPFSEYRFIK